MPDTYARLTLPEFEREMATTRRLLERIPADKLGWKLDERSHTLAWNGGHLAEIPGWARNILTEASFDENLPGGPPQRTPEPDSVDELLALFDANARDAADAIAGLRDDALMEPWQLKDNGQVLFEAPRVVAFRTWILSHSIHHRAILSVYFRQLGVKVPAIYGPSSDEAPE